MFTDIVGYTSLSQTNETATMRLLDEHRAMLRPIFSAHGGREVKTIGDAFLVEFDSSLEAVRCAQEIQGKMSERRQGSPPGLKARIGIHVGEVIHADGDVYGDAVNLAARIEPLAEPGGICISKQVFEFVQNKVDAQLTKMGPVALKNVKAPMEIYKVLPSKRAGSVPVSVSSKRRVAVLPFDNFSQESGDDYFADGMTEEMIGTLSKIRELSVISRTSVMQYKGKPKQISEIGRELNAGTILEGSVRKAGNRARISIQMIDATDDRHVWAESYDRDLQDIFAVQSDIASKVADALRIELAKTEEEAINEAPTKSVEANLLFFKGLYRRDGGAPSDFLKGIEYFELAVEQDPEFALAYANISTTSVAVAGEGMPPVEAFAKARSSLAHAMALNPRLAEVHNARGWLAYQGDWDWTEAEKSFREAISINPSLALAHDFYGRLLCTLGRFYDGIVEVERAYELDPKTPWVVSHLALAYWMAGRGSDAINMLNKLMRDNPKFARTPTLLSMVHATEGRKDDAMREADVFVAGEDEGYFLQNQALVHAYVGSVEKAREILGRLQEGKYKGYASPARTGAIYYLTGDKNTGYDWIKKSADERDPAIPWSNMWPILEPLREDSRYLEILRQVNLP